MHLALVASLLIVACCCLACWLAFFEAKKYETDIEDGNRISKGSGYTMCLIFGIVAILIAAGLFGYLGYSVYASATSTATGTDTGMIAAIGGMGILLLPIGILLLTVAGKLKKTVRAYENGQHKDEVLVLAGKAKKSAQTFAIVFSAILGLVAIAFGIKMKFSGDTSPPTDAPPPIDAMSLSPTPVEDITKDVFFDAVSSFAT